jgi:hypothetical protein
MTSTRVRRYAVGLAAVVLGIGVALPFLPRGQDTEPGASQAADVPEQTALDAQRLRHKPLGPRPCETAPAGRPFRPARVTVAGVTDGAAVLPLPRDEHGVPGVPPTTDDGKQVFAWDEDPVGVRPGGRRGNVLLNAHTWPDGSALGNRLLAGLQEDGTVVVHGEDGERLCYRVTDRVEVPGDRPYPRYYADTGREQLPIIVCSGRRLGPGQWTHRTIWFASPVR